jgi:hypothetical protein
VHTEAAEMPNFIEITDISSKAENQRVLINVDWIKAIHSTQDDDGCNIIVGDGYSYDSRLGEIPVEVFPAKESYDQVKAMLRSSISTPQAKEVK